MRYSFFALKNLIRRKIRTGLTVFSIAVAVAVLFTLLSFNKGYQRALTKQLQQMGVHIMVVPRGCPFEIASLVLKGGKIPTYLSEKVMDEIDKVKGVEIAAPGLMHGIVRPEEGRTDIYLGIDERIFKLKHWWGFKEGGYFKGENEMILGWDTALIEQREVGDLLYVPEIDREFKVVGILKPTGTQDDGFFYIPLRVAQRVFHKLGKITVVQIRVKDPAQANQIAERLKEIRGTNVLTMSELMGTMLTLMDSAKMLIFSIVLIAIVISALGVVNTVLMSVFERTREIGVMRATGASKSHIFTLIWLETLIISFLGGMAGLFIALIGAKGIERVVKRFMPVVVKGSVVSLEPRTFLLCLLFVITIGIVAGLYPAYKAARANPVDALRVE